MYIREITALANAARRHGYNVTLDHPHGTIFRPCVELEGGHPRQRALMISYMEINADCFHAALYLPDSKITPSEFAVVTVVNGDIVKMASPIEGVMLVALPRREGEEDVIVRFDYALGSHKPEAVWFTQNSEHDNIKHYDVNSPLRGEFCLNRRY